MQSFVKLAVLLATLQGVLAVPFNPLREIPGWFPREDLVDKYPSPGSCLSTSARTASFSGGGGNAAGVGGVLGLSYGRRAYPAVQCEDSADGDTLNAALGSHRTNPSANLDFNPFDSVKQTHEPSHLAGGVGGNDNISFGGREEADLFA